MEFSMFPWSGDRGKHIYCSCLVGTGGEAGAGDVSEVGVK